MFPKQGGNGTKLMNKKKHDFRSMLMRFFHILLTDHFHISAA